jgi:sugar lactone lactonase YvrE
VTRESQIDHADKLAPGNRTKGEAMTIRQFIYAAALCTSIAAVANAATVSVPEKSQPESITIAPNGDLILGSAASPKIYRAKKGSEKTEVFVDVSTDGAGSFLGVLADASTNTLWGCQIYTAQPGASPRSALRGFDLKTGAAKFRWELPGEKNLCNDFVVGPDKALYISDTLGAKIWRLKAGATAPEMFSDDRSLYGIDGITFLGDTLYENNVIFNKLYRVPMDASGNAGKPVDIWMDKPIRGPDGMRAANGKLFLTENGAGKVDMVTVNGDTANITVLQEGLATPTAIEPTADTLWFGERAGDRARSMPLPK